MTNIRVALANIEYPSSPDESIASATRSIADAAAAGAALVCFPECYVPGYRTASRRLPPPDPVFLERAWSEVATAASRDRIAVILGTERVVNGSLVMTAAVIAPEGTIAGFQDKVQIDPSEESTYAAGEGRRVFQAGSMTFGIVICH